jgi:hypothetical protein
VNILEPGVCFNVSLLSAVSRVGAHSIPILTAMSDPTTLNTTLLKDMISSKNDDVCISHLSDLPLQIIFNVWWVSMHEGLKRPIA